MAGFQPSGGQALVPGVSCVLEHSYVEALHSALQILVAVSVGEGREVPGEGIHPDGRAILRQGRASFLTRPCLTG